MTIMSLEDWAKVDVDEIRERWEKRRKELEEIKKKKKEKEKRIEEAKKKKEDRRKRAIRERRCFVCGIFGHMARYCRNRKEKRGLSIPQNKFEVLKNRVIQRGERSGREVGKGRREILREEKRKMMREAKGKPQKKKIRDTTGNQQQENKKEGDRKKELKEKGVEMRSFSRGEILRRRYPLA